MLTRNVELNWREEIVKSRIQRLQGMVSRYGVSKDGGAVGVALGIGTMHCLLPHCGGPHHFSPHPQNNANHVHSHNHQQPTQPPPQLSPHQHLGQLSHPQHQQQPHQHAQQPQQYRIVAGNARSDFHVPGQTYGPQPGAQVAGGGNIGVSGNRGPPSLAGIQSIGQSTPGIQSSGPGAQQQPPQSQTPGVQQQQTVQGPPPTTTPPVHTPSPQDMGKQVHHQTQPSPLQQTFVGSQSRPMSHNYYHTLPPRAVQSHRGSGHRGGHGGGATHVVNMSTVAGSAGQPQMYSHANIPGGPTMFVSGQVPNIHTGAHQTAMYSVNSQISQLSFPPQHRHQAHQNQHFFTAGYPAMLPPTSFLSFPQGPGAQIAGFCYPTHPNSTTMNLSRTNANAVSAGAQHVGGPLAGAQTTAGVPQAALQQSTQQAIPSMGIPLTHQAYTGHNSGVTTTSNVPHHRPARPHALTNIVNPDTGENIADEIYRTAKTPSVDKAQQNPEDKQKIVAQFSTEVYKRARSDSGSATTSESTESASKTVAPVMNASESTPATKVESSLQDTTSQQCNNSSPVLTQAAAVVVEPCVAAPEVSKPPKAWQRDLKPAEDAPVVASSTEEVVSAPKVQPTPVEITDTQVKSASPTIPDTPAPVTYASTTQHGKDAYAQARGAVSSPPRRKPQQPQQKVVTDFTPRVQVRANEPTVESVPAAPVNAVEPEPSRPSEPRERKISDKSTASRPATAAPAAQKSNGDTAEKSDAETKDLQAASKSDGKSMQKQKSKNKLKGRDLNRKGAEKEGTDMDAFVNSAAPQPAGVKPDTKVQEVAKVISPVVDEPREISAKEKEVNEVKPDLEPESKCELSGKEAPDFEPVLIDKVVPSIDNDEETSKELLSSNEDSNKSVITQNTDDVVDHSNTNHAAVEAIVAQKNEENVKVSASIQSTGDSISVPDVAVEKEEKNDTPTVATVEAETTESKPAAPAAPARPVYNYAPHQWSPTNTSGKKQYDFEFLLKLKEDPICHIRPPHLPDLDIVLRDTNSRQSFRVPVDMRGVFRDTRTHENLLPGFAKSSYNAKLPPITKKGSHGYKPKPTNKPSVIHVTLSLHEDVKLRETENAWVPTALKVGNPAAAVTAAAPSDNLEQIKTDRLFKKMRSILNKLTPQNFDALRNQVHQLEIDTLSRLEGVINLVFIKAIEEPNFSVQYALLCKELEMLNVDGVNSSSTGPNFRKLLVNRCQSQFEKNFVDESVRILKVKDIEICTDAVKKKELQIQLEEEDRKVRVKSVGNVRFIGELFKQGMLTPNIMNKCCNHLLSNADEENLECLCKLLTTIGKLFESKADITTYFVTLGDLARKSNKKISSRVRFMIQDVIDLKQNRWIPRRDDSNPKTMDQIQKEAEIERFEVQLSHTPMNTPRRDDRNNDRRRNRGGPSFDDGWSEPVGSKTRQPYSVQASKLSTKTPPLEEIKLGSRNNYMWNTGASAGKPVAPAAVTPNKYALLENMQFDMPEKRSIPVSGSRSTGPREYRSDYKYGGWDNRGSRNNSQHMSSNSSTLSSLDCTRSQSISMPPPSMKYKLPTSSQPPVSAAPSIAPSKPTKTEDELKAIIKSNLNDCPKIPSTAKFIPVALETIQECFDNSTYPLFVTEVINAIIDKTEVYRQRYSALFAHMIDKKIIPLSLVQDEYEKLLECADDLVIDIPKCWTYFAEILVEMIVEGAHPLAELKRTIKVLKAAGTSGKLLGELFTKLAKEQGPKWLTDKWQQSGLAWSDVMDLEREKLDDFIDKYKLKFIIDGCSNVELSPAASELTFEQIQEHLEKLMKTDYSFDNVTSWVATQVGERVKQPEFIRILITAITKVATEAIANGWKLNELLMESFLPLITRYVDADPQLELQCLFGVETCMSSMAHPYGVIQSIVEILWDGGTISDEAFMSWETCTSPIDNNAHAVAMKALTSFFVLLRENINRSSDEA